MKRFVWITPGKGGTGKTSFMCLLFYWLVKAKAKVKAYDADVENSSFYKAHKNAAHSVEMIDIVTKAVAREFLTTLKKLEKKRPDVILLDMPAASGFEAREIVEKFQLFRAQDKDFGYRITLCTVLSPEPDPIISLLQMMEAFGSNCDYVVIKPDVWTQDGKDYSVWEESETRKRCLELQGVEIEMPLLEPLIFQDLRKNNQSFFAIDHLEFPDNLLAGSFLEVGRLELDKAAHYLGLPTPAMAASPTQSEGDNPGSESNSMSEAVAS